MKTVEVREAYIVRTVDEKRDQTVPVGCKIFFGEEQAEAKLQEMNELHENYPEDYKLPYEITPVTLLVDNPIED